MMTRETARNREQMQLLRLDDLVPKDHLVRKLDKGGLFCCISALLRVRPIFCVNFKLCCKTGRKCLLWRGGHSRPP